MGHGVGWLAVAVVLFLMAGPTVAQFVQYVPPGTFQERREDTEKILERNMDNARWKAGRVLFDPWFGLRNFGYVDNVQNSGASDITATVGAGVRGWLPVGSEFTLSGHLLPEYVWWKDLDQCNRLNGRYGLGLFGNLGRAGMEFIASRVDDAEFFSREFEDRVNTRTDELGAKFELEIGGGFTGFASGLLKSIDYLDVDQENLPSLAAVDRDEDIVRGGVSYRFPLGLELGGGFEYSKAEFEPGISDRSNSGTAPLIVLDFEGSSLRAQADVAFRSLSADGDSRFVDYDDVTGRYQLGWRTFGRLEFQLFGGNDLVYSFTDTWAYFEDTSIGVGLRAGINRGISGRIFFETGDNDYTPFDAGGINRVDDLRFLGVGFLVSVRSVLDPHWWV